MTRSAQGVNIGIDESDRAAIAEDLNKLLADTYTLYLTTHNFHWNVRVPNVQPWPENARFALRDSVEIQSGLDGWYPAMVVGHNEMRGYYHVRYDHEQHLICDAHEDKMRPAR